MKLFGQRQKERMLRVVDAAIMGVNHGRDEPPRICSGGTLIQVVPPDFCRFSKFQALAMDSSPSPQIYAIGSNRIFMSLTMKDVNRKQGI
jgi:hypothetical protein